MAQEMSCTPARGARLAMTEPVRDGGLGLAILCAQAGTSEGVLEYPRRKEICWMSGGLLTCATLVPP